MIVRLLRRLLGEPEVIGAPDYQILHRWTLFDVSWGRLALHHIQPGIEYKDFHDHGHFMVLACFAGSYMDVKIDGKHDLIRPGAMRFRGPPHPHKIVPGPEGAWTICFQGPIRKDEGFYLPDGSWVPAEEYEQSERWPWRPPERKT